MKAGTPRRRVSTRVRAGLSAARRRARRKPANLVFQVGNAGRPASPSARRRGTALFRRQAISLKPRPVEITDADHEAIAAELGCLGLSERPRSESESFLDSGRAIERIEAEQGITIERPRERDFPDF